METKKELSREFVKTIGQMTTAKLALRATAPLSLRCQGAYVKYQALRRKVNNLFRQLEGKATGEVVESNEG